MSAKAACAARRGMVKSSMVRLDDRSGAVPLLLRIANGVLSAKDDRLFGVPRTRDNGLMEVDVRNVVCSQGIVTHKYSEGFEGVIKSVGGVK